MRKAPCINADQSQMQEAPTNQLERVCSSSIVGPLGNIKEVLMHSRAEYDRNIQEMLELYQELSWKDQVLLIGRLSVMVEREREKRVAESAVAPSASSGQNIIQFPACEGARR